jgi:hypothetical protein
MIPIFYASFLWEKKIWNFPQDFVFCAASATTTNDKHSRFKKKNSINDVEKRHKIKWHYLKLVFIYTFSSFFFFVRKEVFQTRANLLWNSSLASLDNQFSFRDDKRQRKWRFHSFFFHLKLSLFSQSKRYQEMWFKIGGEPRCFY